MPQGRHGGPISAVPQPGPSGAAGAAGAAGPAGAAGAAGIYPFAGNPGWSAEVWYAAGRVSGGAAVGNYALTVSGGPNPRSFFVPFFVGRACTVDKLGTRVTGSIAASTIRLALYSAHASTRLPDALLADSGDLSAAAIATVSAAVNAPLTAGLYWANVYASVTGITIGAVEEAGQGGAQIIGYLGTNLQSQARSHVAYDRGTYGAPPANAPAVTISVAGATPAVFLRFSA